MDAINKLPKPVVIGAVIVLVLVAAFSIFTTIKGVVTNNGYGTREDIAKLQAQGGGATNGGRTMPDNAVPQTQGGPSNSRGGYPGGSNAGPGNYNRR